MQHDNEYFKKFLWFDEGKVEIFGHSDVPMYGEKMEQPTVSRTPSLLLKHNGGNIMFWRCFVYSENEGLRIIDNTMKPAKYNKILEDCLQSSVQKLELGPD